MPSTVVPGAKVKVDSGDEIIIPSQTNLKQANWIPAGVSPIDG